MYPQVSTARLAECSVPVAAADVSFPLVDDIEAEYGFEDQPGVDKDLTVSSSAVQFWCSGGLCLSGSSD